MLSENLKNYRIGNGEFFEQLSKTLINEPYSIVYELDKPHHNPYILRIYKAIREVLEDLSSKPKISVSYLHEGLGTIYYYLNKFNISCTINKNIVTIRIPGKFGNNILVLFEHPKEDTVIVKYGDNDRPETERYFESREVLKYLAEALDQTLLTDLQK
jgi:hypothetical protein